VSVVPYIGQALEPGMIVCRRSIMLNGFASRPVTIVRVAGSRAVVRDRDGDEKRIGLSTIEFIVGSIEEGMRLAEASLAYTEAERVIEREQAKARAERKRLAIEAAIAAGGEPE
jgi:hypothetical protein